MNNHAQRLIQGSTMMHCGHISVVHAELYWYHYTMSSEPNPSLLILIQHNRELTVTIVANAKNNKSQQRGESRQNSILATWATWGINISRYALRPIYLILLISFPSPKTTNFFPNWYKINMQNSMINDNITVITFT